MKFSRRTFLKTVVVSAGAAAMGPGLGGCDSEPARPASEVFPQSVASGDPRADSIVLWTRTVPVDEAMGAFVELEVATDAEFSNRMSLTQSEFTASVDHDHCLRVKIVDLDPATTYYYRFMHEGTASNPGRFVTASAAGATDPVRFATMSCQDRVGRFYNTATKLLEAEYDDLNFIVHLGDYVYETTGDPAFMNVGSDRGVTFRAPEEAIALGDPGETYYAAKSIGNYRDLYRAYRSDSVLQQLHERFAFICVWDDHEFSDDSWQDVATYSDGVNLEQDTARKLASEQAYFEYMPVALDDETSGVLERSEASLFPNTRLYRSFDFGQTMRLAMIDYRSFRPDHPIPEDIPPSLVAVDQAQVRETLMRLVADGDLPADTDVSMAFEMGPYRSYIDVSADTTDLGQALEAAMTAAYVADGVEAERAASLASTYAGGKHDAALVSEWIEGARATFPSDWNVPTVDPADTTLERGIPYVSAGKSSMTGQLGTRYLVLQSAYDMMQAYRSRVAGETEFDNVLGDTQEAWLRDTLNTSSAVWNMVGCSVCTTTLVLDLTSFAGQLPDSLPAERYYLSADQWDGFPERRRKLMREVYGPANAVLLAGDIHAALGSDFDADADGNRALELTTTSVSSTGWKQELYKQGSGVPAIRDSGLLEPVLQSLDGLQKSAFSPLKQSQSDMNGILVVSLTTDTLRAEFSLLPQEATQTNYYDRTEELADMWQVVVWTSTKSGSSNGPLTQES